jgi:lipopolysaccharide/colanic/teichoic acid biosynthesis glycosyltransferase
MNEQEKEIVEQTKKYLPPYRKVGKGYYFFKRLFDIVSSFSVIVVFSPLLILLFLIELFPTRGHVIFKDKRVGYHEKPMYIWKFRSMYADAESHPERYFSPEQMKMWQTERKVENDPRIIKSLTFMRKSSLDELPQLFNILFGTMSVVGPRPITEKEFNTYYGEEQKKILSSARPGLTGYWQVYARNDATYETGIRTKMNMDYFTHRSLAFDAKLLLMTIPAMFKHKGK